MVVAFDFDGVVSDKRMQKLVKKFIDKRCEVWIITARGDNSFNRRALEPTLDKLYLSFSSVIFCDEKPKIEMLQAINADLYIDNENNELDEINDNTNTIALLF